MASLVEWTIGRFLAALFGTAVVAVIAGVVIGRASAPDHTGKNPQTSPAATASASVPPVAAGSALPGAPSRVNSLGIPVGYPHTEAGAISACGNYISSVQDVGSRSQSRLETIFGSISNLKTATILTKRIVSSDAQTAKNFDVPSINSPSFEFELRVVGYKVESSSRDKATVSIWSTAGVGVFGGTDDLAPQQRWGTDVCTVVWGNNDWRLSAASDGPDGPSITDRTASGMERFSLTGGSSS